MFFSWVTVSSLDGPFQVAEVFLHKKNDEGKMSKIPVGFQVFLTGFGAVSQSYQQGSDADSDAKCRNEKFFEVHALKQGASQITMPNLDLSGESEQFFYGVIKSWLDHYQLTATPGAARSRGLRG